MSRVLKWCAAVLAAILVLIPAAASWVLFTESGSRFALAQAGAFLPDGIDPGRLSGRLGDRVVLSGTTVSLDGMELRITRAWVEWSLWTLLEHWRVDIDEIGAEGVRYRALDAGTTEPPDDAPFALPERITLPLPVTVHRAIVTDARLATAPDTEPLAFHRLRLEEAVFTDSRLTLESVAIDSPRLSARGRVSATAAGDYPLDADLTWQLQLPDYATLDGATRISGSLASLSLEQHLAAPYHTELTATVSNLTAPDRSPAVSARLTASDVRLSAVGSGLPELTANVEAEAAGPIDALDVQADVDASDPRGRRFRAIARARVTGESVTVNRLTVRQPDREGRLTADGRIALAGGVEANLTVQWRELRWPLAGDPTLISPNGRLRFDGPLDDYRLSLDAELEPPVHPPLSVRVDGRGGLDSIDVSLDATSADASLTGQVTAAWDPALRTAATIELRDFDPSVLAADWPGAVNVTLDGQAQMQGGNLEATVSRLRADGTLRQRALELAAGARFLQTDGGPVIDVDELDASLGDSRLHLSGRIDQRADLRWDLASPDLSAVVPTARGRLSGSGRVTGPLPRVRVDAEVDGRGLEYAGHSLQNLTVDADVDLSGRRPSTLSIDLEEATVAGTDVRRMTADASGRPADHELNLAVDTGTGSGSLTLDGRLPDPWGDQPVWSYTLNRGRISPADLPPWTLAAPAGGRLGAGLVQVERQCWEAAEARACVQGHRGPDGVRAQINVSDLASAHFGALLPADMKLNTTVDATARASQPGDGALTATAEVSTGAGRLTVAAAGADDDGTSTVVQLEPSTASLALDASEASGRLTVNLARGRLHLDAATSPSAVTGALGMTDRHSIAGEPLSGNVEANVPDLAFLSTLLPRVEDLHGSLSGDLSLGGTLGRPTVAGSLDLSGGAVTVPPAGITVRDVALSLVGRGRELGLTGQASSGGGKAHVDGRLRLPGDTPTARVAIRGERFQAVDNADARVLVSPDLEVTADAERVTVNGKLHVPQADITPGTRSSSAVTVSDDQVLVRRETESGTAAARPLHAEVRVTLGDEVRFDGFGLSARFEGDVLVRQQPDTPATATGELRIVDGEYRAYGQGLVIDSGRIYFAGGPVTQPALDVRAVRRPREGIVVGADVQGTVQSPTFELFSDPSMSQQEQLSYLVLGRALDETPDGQESALSRAALAMGLKGGDFLARNIGESVGLDQIGIETGSGEAGAPTDPNQAALVVGKYLSPRIYVSYGIGLFNPESVLEMQYEISRNWTLVTRSSGESTGADVLYTVEVGGQPAEAP